MLCYCYRAEEKNVTSFPPPCHSDARKAEESAHLNEQSRSFAEPVLSGRSVSKQ